MDIFKDVDLWINRSLNPLLTEISELEKLERSMSERENERNAILSHLIKKAEATNQKKKAA